MISIAVQAGGKSRRMGEEKALVPFLGKPLIEHVIARLQALGTDLFITSNNPQQLQYLGLRIAADEKPGTGSLNGLLTALLAAEGTPVLVAACDMPFVSPRLFHHMLQRCREYDVVIPWRDGHYEPMHAVYAASCIPAVRAALNQGEKRMVSFFTGLRVLQICDPLLGRLDYGGMAFFNLNTPQDLEQAESWVAANGFPE